MIDTCNLALNALALQRTTHEPSCFPPLQCMKLKLGSNIQAAMCSMCDYLDLNVNVGSVLRILLFGEHLIYKAGPAIVRTHNEMMIATRCSVAPN